eukprot:gene17718-biopygen8094
MRRNPWPYPSSESKMAQAAVTLRALRQNGRKPPHKYAYNSRRKRRRPLTRPRREVNATQAVAAPVTRKQGGTKPLHARTCGMKAAKAAVPHTTRKHCYSVGTKRHQGAPRADIVRRKQRKPLSCPWRELNAARAAVLLSE